MPAPDAAGPPGPRSAEEVRDSNHRAIMRTLVIAIAVGVLIDAVLIAAAAIWADTPAVLGALIGTALALVVTVPTLLSVHLGRHQSPLTAAAILAGSWLAKMFVLVIVLAALPDVAAISRPWLGFALLGGALAAAVTEAAGLLAKRPRLEVEPVERSD